MNVGNVNRGSHKTNGKPNAEGYGNHNESMGFPLPARDRVKSEVKRSCWEGITEAGFSEMALRKA
jgi:hypothetical protein